MTATPKVELEYLAAHRDALRAASGAAGDCGCHAAVLSIGTQDPVPGRMADELLHSIPRLSSYLQLSATAELGRKTRCITVYADRESACHDILWNS